MFRERIGYGKRVKNSVGGFVFGIFLCFGAVVLLAWNERDAVRQTGAITEIDKVAIADVPSNSVDSSNDGKLVHVNATASTDEVLEYAEFGIQENAIRLRWDASIYQWEEDKKQNDDEVRYSYSQEWVDRPIDSTGFRHPEGHSNQGSQQHFHDGSTQAKDVRFGAFRLSEKLIGQINVEEPLTPDASVAAKVEPAGVIRNGVFYTGNPDAPLVGDERVELFKVGPSHEATVMARQNGDLFAAYETKVGVNKEILYLGKLTKSEVISRQRTEAAMKRWLLRGAGFLCIWIGSSLLLKADSCSTQLCSLVGPSARWGNWCCRLLDRSDCFNAGHCHRLVCRETSSEHDPVARYDSECRVALSTERSSRSSKPVGPPPLPPNLNS